jgi:L-threonylcarbamoyladenylate synthase
MPRMHGALEAVGVESTIIDCTSEQPRILRPGAITSAMIQDVTGLSLTEEIHQGSDDSNIRVSGSLENHYSPQALVILDQAPVPGSGFIALKSTSTPAGVIRLAAPKTVEEFARLLYESLREGDHQKLNSIYIEQPTGDGLAIAIRDRLGRSAKGR